MDDLISRQAAIDNMARAIWGYPNEIYPQLNDYNMAVALAKDGLMGVPSAQQWIPCSERLPEEGISVLGTFEGESGNFVLNHITARLVIDGKDVWCSGQGLSAIAWMPWPEPYKEETDG